MVLAKEVVIELQVEVVQVVDPEEVQVVALEVVATLTKWSKDLFPYAFFWA